jgi:Ca2+-binding EF-hand superfamily protein
MRRAFEIWRLEFPCGLIIGIWNFLNMEHWTQSPRLILRRSATLLALVFVALNACQTNKNLQPPETAGTQGGGFDLADANHDGKLSRDEASDFLVNEIFDSRDADHDGKLTRQEWVGSEPSRAANFKKRDANHDGIVTRDEALKYARGHGIANKIMTEADKNHDGMLDRKEVQAYYASREGPPR